MLTELEQTEQALMLAESEITDQLGVIQELQNRGEDISAALRKLMATRQRLHQLCLRKERLSARGKDRAEQGEGTLRIRVI
jgi:hypothetical protein